MKPMIAAASVAMLVFGSAAFAQTTTPQPTAPQTTSPPAATVPPDSTGQTYTESEKSDFLASKLMNARVYATSKDFDATSAEKISADWDDIGEINNLLIAKDGKVNSVILGVGGFLSIGEKNVAVDFSELRFVKKTGGDTDDFYVLVKSDKTALEKAPAWDMSGRK